MKKSLGLSLVVALMLVLISGTVFGQNVTLTLMWQNSGQETGYDWMRDTVQLYQELNPHVQFELMDNTWGDQYLAQITTLMATGRTPDIFSTWTSGRMEPFVEAGRLYDISERLENDPEFYQFLQEGPLAATSFGDGIYAIPHNLNAEFIYYNKRVFNDLGLSVPQTWDDFLHIIETAKANGIIPIALGNSEIWTGTIIYMMLAERIGGIEAIQESMNGERPWNDDIYVQAGQMLQELIAMGAYEPNVNGISPEEARGKFMNDQAAMWINGTWDIATLNHQMGQENYGMFSLPTPPGGKGNINHHIVFADQAWAIGENSQNKDEAWEFLKFMYSPERQAALVQSGTIVATNVSVDPESADARLVEALNLMTSAEATMFPWDIPLGNYLGTELNKAVQLLYMGQAPEQVLAQFQAAVEEEALFR